MKEFMSCQSLLKQLSIKRILVTNYYVNIYSGSELITLDIAKFFRNCEIDVVVASFHSSLPLVKYFHDLNVQVVNLIELPQVLIGQTFDLVWAHHWPTLGFCLYELDIFTRYLILGSLSPYEPLEALVVASNQAHSILFNSKENLNYQSIELDCHSQSLVKVFPNALTSDWLEDCLNLFKSQSLQRLGVVSNHISPEVIETIALLENSGVEVKAVGTEVGQVYVSPDWIDGLDAVMTIGHTVQKAMARGVSVYCYDRFGGPGWLTPENLDSAAIFNYSGRCCNRKLSATELFQDILQGYEQTLKYREALRQVALTHYNLENNILEVLNYLGKCDWTFDRSKLSLKERKICQLLLRHEFKLNIPATVNIKASTPSCVAIQAEIVSSHQWNELLAACFIDGLPEKGHLFDAGQPFQFGGIALSKTPDNRITEISTTDQDFKTQAKIGLHSPGLGQQYPNLPFSYSSRFLFELPQLPNSQEIFVSACFSQGQEVTIAKLTFLRASQL